MYRLFANSMMNGKAFAPKMDADKGGGAGAAGGQAGGAAGAEGGNAGAAGGAAGTEGGAAGGTDGGKGAAGEGGKPDKVEFTPEQQTFINDLINKTIGTERTKAEKEREEAERKAAERAKLTAEEQAELDRKDREEKAEKREQAANNRIKNLEAKDVARESGVPAKKLERFLKLVDISDVAIDDAGNADRAAVQKAVNEVLADMPEFKAADNSQGPDGNFNGGGAGAKFTKSQIESMTAEEINKNWDDVQASMQFHNKK